MMHNMMKTAMGYNPYNTKAPDFIISYIDYLVKAMKSDAIDGDYDHFKQHHNLVVAVLNEITLDNQVVSDDWTSDLYDMMHDHAWNTLKGNEDAIREWLCTPYSEHFVA